MKKRKQGKKWTGEQRARFQATMAEKRQAGELKKSGKSQTKYRQYEQLERAIDAVWKRMPLFYKMASMANILEDTADE